MTPISQDSRTAQRSRRWPRHKVQLPVRILSTNGLVTAPILARGNDVSRAGMALHAAIALTPGDRMDLEFATPTPLRVSAVVRNRIGDCLGLEFLTQLPSREPANATAKLSPSSPPLAVTANPDRPSLCDPELLNAGLERKREQLKILQKQIEALTLIIPLLSDTPEERPTPASRSVDRPWPGPR